MLLALSVESKDEISAGTDSHSSGTQCETREAASQSQSLIKTYSKSLPCEFLSSLGKSHGHGVHAISQAGGLWPIIKNVAQVCVAKAAGNRSADHAQARVHDFSHVFFCDWLPKAGPAGTRIKLRAGIKESRIAADTTKYAFRVIVWIFVGEGAFSPCVPCDFKGKWTELFLPLVVGLYDRNHKQFRAALAGIGELDDGHGFCRVRGSGLGIRRTGLTEVPPANTEHGGARGY